MTTHSNILAWTIPWTEEPGGLQSTGGKESDTTQWLSMPACKDHFVTSFSRIQLCDPHGL